jgi:hypothetical protein
MFRANATEDTSILVTAFLAKVFGIDRVTGAIRWKVALDQAINDDVVELAIGGGVVVAVSRNFIAFIDYATGRVLKHVERAGDYKGRASMIVHGEQIMIGGQGQVECYTNAGDLVWVQGFKGEGTGSVALGVPGIVRQADDRGSR